MSLDVSNQSSSSSKSRKKAAFLSLGIGIILLFVKFFAYGMTSSQAIFSDAVESIVNVLGASAALWAIHIAEQPADNSHPYGHGKMEYFSSAFEGGLIGIAAIILIFESIQVMVNPTTLQRMDSGILLVTIAGLANLATGMFLLSRGKSEDSPALKASGLHLLSDFWTSLGVVLGLGMMLWTGWLWMDAVIGLIIGLNLGIASFKIVGESLNRLADHVDDALLDVLCPVLERHSGDGIIQIHDLRVLKSGRFHHVDAHVIIPEHWTIQAGHDYTLEYEQEVMKELGKTGEIAFHIDPCGQKYCSNCRLKGCDYRQEPFQSRFSFSKEYMTNIYPE